jgi:hypothetical protein
MYKIFKVIYDNGGWHSVGDTPHFYYIAKSVEEVIAYSKKYKEFLKRRDESGGYLGVTEVSGFDEIQFENIDKFDISVSINKL